MTQSKPPEHGSIEALFAEARNAPPQVPDALMQRVVADALAEIPKPARTPIWKQVFGSLGGWPAMAGLAVTTCVGVWVGGVLSDDLGASLGLSEGVLVDVGSDLGTFDILLLDG